MTSEEKDRFKTKLKDAALSSFKLFSGNCKFENNLSTEEMNSLEVLMANKNIVIQKVDKGNIEKCKKYHLRFQQLCSNKCYTWKILQLCNKH